MNLALAAPTSGLPALPHSRRAAGEDDDSVVALIRKSTD
ncbi:hypothetical protein CDS [Bradyrhizobium sp.]|nr:hypothetical protein CDS [Bradyrhizobium sp.]